MAEYPYALGVAKIPQLFKTVGEKGIPSKVTQKWLSQFGMGSSNDRRLIPLLRFVGFIDEGEVPTDRWRAYRGAKSREVMAEAILEGYSALYADHPDAHNVPPDQLTVYFRSHSSNNADTVSRVVNTFRTLIGLADFSASSLGSNYVVNSRSSVDANGTEDREPELIGSARNPIHNQTQPIVINVNLQLTLPESDNPEVFDALFASLRRNVLAPGTPSDG